MSSADGPGADPKGSRQASELPGKQVHVQLVEALMLSLLEKGVLTRNDALSIVQSVAQVQRGAAVEDGNSAAQIQANVRMLQRLYASFEAFSEGPGAGQANWENVRRLRPPIHGDHPEFPRDD